MAQRNPADIARETLKLLASRRLTPTPENYQAVYEEVAGLLPQVPFPQTPLRRIASILPTQTPAQTRIARLFSDAVEARDWTALQTAIADYAQLDLGLAPVTAEPVTTTEETVHVLPQSLALQLARVIETSMAVLGEEDPRMHALTDQLISFLRVAPPPLPALEQMLHNYSYRLSFTSEDLAQRRRCIHAMLRMVGEHICSVASQDTQLQQQEQALASAMEMPWTLQQLDTIQTHLKNLLFRHVEIEGNRADAHTQLKQLLTEHTSQMAHLGKLSESHASALQDCAQQIQQSRELGDLAQVLEAVVQSGNALATENRLVQAQLADQRAQIQAQEAQIAQLTQSLHAMEESTRHDPETGALNTQGLQEAMQSEAARSRRHPHITSLACLHIDPTQNQILLSEPAARSAALIHVARLVRGTLRPQDALARTDTHSFVVLFPDTTPNQAAQALARVQDELQQRPLIHNEQMLTLNIGAGVIALSGLETPSEALQRAAAACEQALRMGNAKIALS
ncbi:GGDEF domain-containing protein [Comamonas sp.]